MKTLIYLLQVSACTGIFYLFYQLVLKQFTFFTLNRWYLLATLVISFAIPLITIPANAPQPLTVIYEPAAAENVQRVIASVPLPGAVAVSAHPAEQAFNWLALLTWFYLAGAAVFALHLLVSLTKLVFRLRGNAVATVNGVKIIRDDRRFKNGSFMNCIFLTDDALTKEELQQVLDHELTHIRLLHSADRILARLVQVILWFNPFSYWYSRAIEVNHEFEVDQQMACSFDRRKYADLLVRLSISPESSLAHHFSMIPLKKRIAMLFNNPTKKMKKIIYLLALPLVVIGGLAFGKRALLNVPAKYIPEEVVEMLAPSPNKAPLSAHPQSESVKQDVAVKMTDEKIIPSIEEAVPVPLPADTLKQPQPKVSAIRGLVREYEGKDPLVIIDGKMYGSEILYRISGDCISRAKFLNVDWAVKEYGERAKEGLVMIATKNGQITFMTPQEIGKLVEEDVRRPVRVLPPGGRMGTVNESGKLTIDAGGGFMGPKDTAEKLLAMQREVTVSPDKTISYRGNKITSITLDGKAIQSTDLAGLSAASIRIIEITYSSVPGSNQLLDLKTTYN